MQWYQSVVEETQEWVQEQVQGRERSHGILNVLPPLLIMREMNNTSMRPNLLRSSYFEYEYVGYDAPNPNPGQNPILILIIE